MWGVIFPVVSILLNGTEISVSSPYFDKTAGPILLLIIILMGIGPILSWRKTTKKAVFLRLLPSFVITIASSVYLVASGIKDFFPLISFLSIIFVLTIIMREWIGGTKSRMGNSYNPLPSFLRMIISNRGRNGGYVVHIAILALAFGVVGTKFYDERLDLNLSINDEIIFDKYLISFNQIEQEFIAENSITKAKFTISNNQTQEKIGNITAMHSYYPNYNQISVRSGILSSPIEDLYIIPKDFIDDNNMTIRIAINPLAWWIWLSGPILILGTLITLWPTKIKKD